MKDLLNAKKAYLAGVPYVYNSNDMKLFAAYAVECILNGEQLDVEAMKNAGVPDERAEELVYIATWFPEVVEYVKHKFS